MKIYDITKGQLITVWIFGILFWISDVFTVLNSYSLSGFSSLLTLLIPAILIFYTLGWKNHHSTTDASLANKKHPLYEEILEMKGDQTQKVFFERYASDFRSLLAEMIDHEERTGSLARTAVGDIKPGEQIILDVFNKERSEETIELLRKMDDLLADQEGGAPHFIEDAVVVKFVSDCKNLYKKK